MPKSTVVHFCFLTDEHFHEAFHLLVVETFGELGMTLQDFDSEECIQIVDETREQIQLLKRLECIVWFC